MGTWTTKFRKPALVAGVLAISLAVNPAIASGCGFAARSAAAPALPAAPSSVRAAAGPIGMVVGAVGRRHHGRAQPQEERGAGGAQGRGRAAGERSRERSKARWTASKARPARSVPPCSSAPARPRSATAIARASPGSARWLPASVTCACGSRVSPTRAADDEINQTLSKERAEIGRAGAGESGGAEGSHGDRGHGRALREHRSTAG